MPTVREVMSTDVISVQKEDAIVEVAKTMRDENIGDVLVLDGAELMGIVTDRDLVVRALASDLVTSSPVGEVCSKNLTTLRPDAEDDEAVRMMREKAIRRIPVVEDGKPVGVVSIGDLAEQKDPDSALADISIAPPNR
jgi:CBS domain-containing protein